MFLCLLLSHHMIRCRLYHHYLINCLQVLTRPFCTKYLNGYAIARPWKRAVRYPDVIWLIQGLNYFPSLSFMCCVQYGVIVDRFAMGRVVICFRSRFSQCVNYMRFNEKLFCLRWQEVSNLVLICNVETSNLVIIYDLRYLTGNVPSVMKKHMHVQRKLHRFAYLIVKIILCY